MHLFYFNSNTSVICEIKYTYLLRDVLLAAIFATDLFILKRRLVEPDDIVRLHLRDTKQRI